MTTLFKEIKKCMHCGCEKEYNVMGSTSSFGAPDLDTRPAPLARNTLEYGIQRCPKCNYSNNDIEKKIDFDDSILKGDKYIEILNSKIPEVAKSYLLAALLKESINDYNLASRFMLNACWVFDDHNIDCKKYRIQCAKLFEKLKLNDTYRLIIIDLYLLLLSFL